jgi:competence protein ComEC
VSSSAWRLVGLAGLSAGLALSPLARIPLAENMGEANAVGAVAAAGAVVLLTRPRSARWAHGWLGLVLVAAAIGGLIAGEARLAAIDDGALSARVGRRAAVVGFVAAVPRRDDGKVLVELGTPRGRLMARAPEPVPDLAVGSQVRTRGVLAEPEPWRRGWLERRGIAMVLEADEIEPTGYRRGGLAGRIDAIRGRAEVALGRGMPEREGALGRGFVLGQDDRIDRRTVDDFKRSGLAHLLAVSGQNVVLLCLLAWPLLALAGLTLRARLIALLALIALYVPVTGAGPSIQRAGVMGAAGVVAGLAARPRSAWYALLLAAAATLALNPRASGDVGWQLSFAATAGIMLWSSRLAAVLAARGRSGSPTRRALAEGVAMTAAATVATVPLMAHHFDVLTVAALPANLLALPAMAPAMWLGMLAGILGQVPAVPVEPVNWVNSLLLAYIAQVARWFGDPGWAQPDAPLDGPVWLAGGYAALVAVIELSLFAARGRQGLTLHRRPRDASAHGALAPGRPRRRLALVAAVGAAAVVALAAAQLTPRSGGPASPGGDALRVRVLDVGQGDAILLDPPEGEPVLVDAGPDGAEVERELRRLGIRELAAAVVTHDQSDHAGGMPDLLAALPVARLGLCAESPLRGAAIASGTEPVSMCEGGELRSGELRLTALWPPPELASAWREDPNRLSLVLLAEWRHFSILLTGDAEAEAVPLDPGAVDVLKVAHHGSADAGLGPLLERTVPKLAVISVGAGNPYGHPTSEVLAELRAARVPLLRTDRDGAIALDADRDGWSASPG